MLCQTTLISLLAALNTAVSAAPISPDPAATELDKGVIFPGPIVPDSESRFSSE